MRTLKKLPLLLALQIVVIHVFAQEKAGDVSSHVKYIDADDIYQFVNGVAVIKKGMSTALIDTNGNFIVPYNQYHFHGGPNSGYASGKDGIIMADEGKADFTPPFVLLNLQGKKIYSSANRYIGVSDGYAETYETPRTSVYINSEGKVIKATAPLKWNGLDWGRDSHDFSSGLTVFFTFDSHKPMESIKKMYGFIDRTNKVIISPIYDYADGFSEGLALVGKYNEFKEMKFGFVDSTGKLVIPLMYSKILSSFKEGLALIEPADRSEFSYAFINRQNEIVIKLKPGLMSRPGDFKDGYAALTPNARTDAGYYEDGYYIDKTGRMLNAKEMSALRPAKFAGIFSSYVRYTYDPYSKFAIAEKVINQKTVKGYVNGLGVFKIIIQNKTF